MMEARVSYHLSERGRRDSRRKGGDGCRLQCVTGPVNDSDVEAFTVSETGEVAFDLTAAFFAPRFDLPQGANWRTADPLDDFLEWDAVPSWDDLLEVVRAIKVAHDEIERDDAESTAKREDSAKQFFVNPFARASSIETNYVVIGAHRYGKFEAVAIEAKRRAEKDQEDLKKANRATLGEWIALHGTENQRQRLTANLLPWAEAYAAADEYLYRSLSGFPLYERFDPATVCRCPDRDFASPECEVKFQSVDATELTATEWDQLAAIKSAAPSATFQLREHRAKCVSQVEPEIKRGVIVKFKLGQLGFKREFTLTGVADDSF